MNPLISIVIPTYNRVDLLHEAIKSVLSQTYTYLECLVIDDFSTDATQSHVKSWILADKRIKYYCNDRVKGAQGARNTGIDKALGEYIIFFDSDDLLHPQKIERQLAAFTEDLDMVYSLDEYFHNAPGDYPVLWNIPNDINDLDRFLFDDPVFHTQSPLWRASELKRLSLTWDESIICWQDWLFHITALSRGVRYICLPLVLGYIRDHEGERSTSYKIFQKESSKLRTALLVTDELKRSKKLNDARAGYLLTFGITILKTALGSFEKADKLLIIFLSESLFLLKTLTERNNSFLKLQLLTINILLPSKLKSLGVRLIQNYYNIQPFPANTWKLLKPDNYKV